MRIQKSNVINLNEQSFIETTVQIKDENEKLKTSKWKTHLNNKNNKMN